MSQVLNNVRDALFAGVGQHAVRGLANRAFVHLHNLSLRFHLQRRTGGLSRVIERGKSGIETIIRLTMMVGIPTVAQFIMYAVILLFQFSFWYVVVVAVTVAVYIWFSIVASNWRIAIRKDMNDADNLNAMSKAVDSLLNFETVKYFGNEPLERARYAPRHAGEIREGGGQDLYFAGLAEYRPGGDLFRRRHDRGHADVGAGKWCTTPRTIGYLSSWST